MINKIVDLGYPQLILWYIELLVVVAIWPHFLSKQEQKYCACLCVVGVTWMLLQLVVLWTAKKWYSVNDLSFCSLIQMYGRISAHFLKWHPGPLSVPRKTGVCHIYIYVYVYMYMYIKTWENHDIERKKAIDNAPLFVGIVIGNAFCCFHTSILSLPSLLTPALYDEHKEWRYYGYDHK